MGGALRLAAEGRWMAKDFILAALQLTVAAANHHPVQQSMIIDFYKTCTEIHEESEPQSGLSYFGFVGLQALQFETHTFPATDAPIPTIVDVSTSNQRISTRQRFRTRFYGDPISVIRETS